SGDARQCPPLWAPRAEWAGNSGTGACDKTRFAGNWPAAFGFLVQPPENAKAPPNRRALQCLTPLRREFTPGLPPPAGAIFWPRFGGDLRSGWSRAAAMPRSGAAACTLSIFGDRVRLSERLAKILACAAAYFHHDIGACFPMGFVMAPDRRGGAGGFAIEV